MEFEDINEHSTPTTRKNTYMCDRCGNNFATSSTLKKHFARKTPCKKTEIVVNNNINSDDRYYSGSAKVELPKFDISKLWNVELEGGFSAILSASRRSGKTTLLKYLYPEFEKVFDIIVFFSDTLHNQNYSFVKAPKFNKYKPEILQDIFEFQANTNNEFKILIIMDDCVSEETKSDASIIQLYLTGRNWNISCIISSQVSTLISKKNRSNTDFVFIGRTNTPENRLNLINTFLVSCVDYPPEVKTKVGREHFLDKYIEENTQDYHFIVLDYQNSGERIYDYKTPKGLKE